MEQIRLEVSMRGEKPTPSALRRLGMIPAVVYGRGLSPVTIALSHKAFERALAQGARHHVVELAIDGNGKAKPQPVMVKEIQMDPTRGYVAHVDFQRISLKEKISAKTPVVLLGSEDVEKRGGIIQHQIRELDVECLPTDIPQSMPIDVSELNAGEHVSIKHLSFPRGVVPLGDPDSVIVSIVSIRRVEEETSASEVAEEEPKESEEKA